MKKEDLERLLTWIKCREIGWRKRAGKESEMPAVMRCMGKAEAYEDVWRQILFPGKSVEDGTLSAGEYNEADAEWRRKAQDVRSKVIPEIRQGGVTHGETESDL